MPTRWITLRVGGVAGNDEVARAVLTWRNKLGAKAGVSRVEILRGQLWHEPLSAGIEGFEGFAVALVVVRLKYSNLAIALAGEIVTAVSGELYAEYIQKHILDPLGMKSTSVFLPEAHRARLATAYGRRMPDGSRAFRPFMDTKGIAPAANFSSTIEDLARFASLQFHDTKSDSSQLLKGSTLHEMRRVHWLQPDWKSSWGLGFQVYQLGKRVLYGHGGSLASYRTILAMDAKERIAALWLSLRHRAQALSIPRGQHHSGADGKAEAARASR